MALLKVAASSCTIEMEAFASNCSNSSCCSKAFPPIDSGVGQVGSRSLAVRSKNVKAVLPSIWASFVALQFVE